MAATRTPPYCDIKPNVEIISLGCVEPTALAHQSPKRALKRSVSPSDAKLNSATDIKLSKFTHEMHASKLIRESNTSSIIEVIKIERPLPSPAKPDVVPNTTISEQLTITTTTIAASPAIKSPPTDLLPAATTTHEDATANLDMLLTADLLTEQTIAEIDQQISAMNCESKKVTTIDSNNSVTIIPTTTSASLRPTTPKQQQPLSLKTAVQQFPATETPVDLDMDRVKIEETLNIYDDDLYNKLHLDDATTIQVTHLDTVHHHTTNSGDSGASTSSIGVNAVTSDDQNIDTPPSLRTSAECSEYSNDPNSLSGGATTMENATIDDAKFDSNFTSNETDSLTSFCTDDIKLENIYKIQNFEGVLQIQPNSLTLEQDVIGTGTGGSGSVVGGGRGGGLMCDGDNGGGGGAGGRNIRCSIGGVADDSSNSTTALADCSGENSADTAVEELEPSIQNLEPLEDDPIEQKFTDAENYVLESGEISRDSGGKCMAYFFYAALIDCI